MHTPPIQSNSAITEEPSSQTTEKSALNRLHEEIILSKKLKVEKYGNSKYVASIRGEIDGFSYFSSRDNYMKGLTGSAAIDRYSWIHDLALSDYKVAGRPGGISEYCASYRSGFLITFSFLYKTEKEQFESWENEIEENSQEGREAIESKQKLQFTQQEAARINEVKKAAAWKAALQPGGLLYTKNEFRLATEEIRAVIPSDAQLEVLKRIAPNILKVRYCVNRYRSYEFDISETELRLSNNTSP